MTYRAAVDIPGLPRHPEPWIYCDGCPASVQIFGRVLRRADDKPPKGWRSAPRDAFRSWHWCAACRSWADKLLAAGLVRDDHGWSRPESNVRVVGRADSGRWWQAGPGVPYGQVDRSPRYFTEAEAAWAWLGEVPR